MAATGIVHRDLKPSNVLLGADGARVIDFGVAHTTDASVLTMTGQQVGTPRSCPRTGRWPGGGHPSDVFSLGSVLAHALTGTMPFGGGSGADVVHRVIYSPPSEACSPRWRRPTRTSRNSSAAAWTRTLPRGRVHGTSPTPRGGTARRGSGRARSPS
ncbi:phosphotransferase [Streptomyces sp. M19]